MKIIMENIRCFAGRHVVDLAPLTLLTGENSSGKTTFLAATSIVRSSDYPMRPQFNAAPFSMGNYDSIATYKGGKFGRADAITLGYDVGRSGDRPGRGHVEATFRKSAAGEPVVSKLRVQHDGRSLTLEFTPHAADPDASLTVEVGANEIKRYDVPVPPDWPLLPGLAPAGYELFHMLRKVELDDQDRRAFETVFLSRWSNGGVTPIAPIRTRPERTWDEPTSDFSPEGKHIPYLLESKLADAAFREALEAFGRESGLFDRLEVRRWGGRPGSPLQLMVAGGGRPANLVDVGYGVSQALPVVVQCILTARDQMILLQQPEVHLHPRAQAALGTLFINTVQRHGPAMVVETHSDYIVDRVRQHVARGDVKPSDISILYFEKRTSDATIHRIELDDHGNIVDPPPGYRDFFMKERMSLLSRSSAR